MLVYLDIQALCTGKSNKLSYNKLIQNDWKIILTILVKVKNIIQYFKKEIVFPVF